MWVSASPRVTIIGDSNNWFLGWWSGLFLIAHLNIVQRSGNSGAHMKC